MSYNIGFVLDGLILVFLSVTIFYAARLSLFLKYFREGREGMQVLIRDLNLTISKAEASIATMKENASMTEADMSAVVNEAKFLSDELRFMNETGDGLADRLEKLAARNRELIDLMENAGGIGTQRIEPFEPSQSRAPQKQRVQSQTQTPRQQSAPIDKDSVQARMQAVREELESDTPFQIEDFDLDAEMEADDEMDFMALEDGAYREDDIPEDFPKQFMQPQGQSRNGHHSKVDTDSKSKLRSFAIFDREFLDGVEDDSEEHIEEDSQFHSRAEQDLYDALQRRKKKPNASNDINQSSGNRISEEA